MCRAQGTRDIGDTNVTLEPGPADSLKLKISHVHKVKDGKP